ncbi:MAG: Replication factor A [Candidatus Heimdallarchaeota archaeon LC_2]|nr:MAG: Replication factor A [Candidatus Heimdallarchaeota archaeon LC_2]
MSKMLSKDEVVEIIIKETDYTKDDVIKMINETIETMDNMVNEEGAAFVVANNLGVSINPKKITEALKINQLVPGQSNITVIGRLNRIYSVREFNRKDNTTGKVRNLEIIDSTGNARISLWDAKTGIVEEKQLKINQIVKISGGSTKMGYKNEIEITLSQRGLIEIETESSENAFPTVESAPFSRLEDISESTKNISIIAKIVDKQGVVEFDKNDKKGKVTNLFVDDGTKKLRLIFWNEMVDMALTFDKGDVIKVTDLRVGLNKYNDVELTFNNYSEISKSQNIDEFNKVEIAQEIVIQSLSDIKAGMNELTITGKLLSKGEIRTFERNNQTGKVGSIIIRDNSQSMKVNLWGEATNYLESMDEGCLVRVHNARASLSDYSGEIELSVSEKSLIDISNDEVDTDLFDSELTTIKFIDVTTAKLGVNIQVSITGSYDAKEIARDDGTTSRVQNLSVVDLDGIYGRVAAWDDNIKTIQSLMTGDGVQLNFVKVKPGSGNYGPEIIIQKETKIEKLPADIVFEKSGTSASDVSYDEISLDNQEKMTTENAKIQFSGKISEVDSFRIYDSCSECAKKVIRNSELEDVGVCEYHGEVQITPKMVLTLIITDDNGSARVTFFNAQTENLFGFNSKDAKDMIDRLGEQEAPINKSQIINKTITIKASVSFNEHRDEYSIRANAFEI